MHHLYKCQKKVKLLLKTMFFMTFNFSLKLHDMNIRKKKKNQDAEEEICNNKENIDRKQMEKEKKSGDDSILTKMEMQYTCISHRNVGGIKGSFKLEVS